MIRRLDRDGFTIDAVPGRKVGDAIRLTLPGLGAIDAVVAGEDGGAFHCLFLDRLAAVPPGVDAAAARVSWPDRQPLRMADPAAPGHWPLPMRAGIAIGGAAALWGLIVLALR